MMQYAILFYEFFKVGLFSIGGGLATLPFLYALADKYPWFTTKMVGDMIAISESTPGPIGINMATYAGFQNSGVLGAFIATVALVFPSVVIIIIISKFLTKFRESEYVNKLFSTIRPTVTGMIGAAGFGVIVQSLFNYSSYTQSGNIIDIFKYKEIILFGIMLFLTNRYKKHPIFYIASAAVIGIIFKF